MYDRHRIAELFASHRPGYSLPQPFYTDQQVHEFDLEAIFYRSWLMVGFEAELERTGSYMASWVGPTPIVVLRNRAGEVVGFHNSCRHRGAQICPTGSGRAPTLVCPYHQWSYALDGRLMVAQGASKDFDLSGLSLKPIKVEVVAGCIYVALSDDAPDFAPFRRALEPALRPHNLQDLKLAHEVKLDEQANWKLVMENGHECNHCMAGHPEFKDAFPSELIDGGSPFPDGEDSTPFMQTMRRLGFETQGSEADWWKIGRIRLSEGFSSFAVDGKPLVRKFLNDANGGNLGTFRWAAEPNSFCHVTSDVAFMFSANPTGPQSTQVTAKWLVHKDAVEGVDYDLQRLTYMWDQTNLQDRALVENNQRGVSGFGYQPGPYTPEREAYVMQFLEWYCARAGDFLGVSEPRRRLASV